VLLGDRYGWVPPAPTVTHHAAEEGFAADVVGHSVTELEDREPLPYDSMPRDVAALYSDAHDRDPEAGERAKKLAGLKQEIEQALPHRVRSYTAGWEMKR
jgi:hypothetical protein